MKKGLLLGTAALLFTTISLAQIRLSLYEEFTGEQCFPCAAVNPGVQALIATNSAAAVHITYPSPFPVAGPLYTRFSHVATDARILYYGITGVPQGRLNGTNAGTGTAFPTPGHAGNLRQADIDAAIAATTPFSIAVSHAFNSTGDSVYITLTISTAAAYTAPSGASLKLRVAAVENLQYPAAPPGINGEQTFPNVVRQMYPSATGTALGSTWTAAQSTTITLRGDVARYIDKGALNLVAWIQNDATKNILQTALSTPVAIPLDAGISAARPPQGLICTPGPASVAHNAYLRNAGTATITSARIYYYSDAAGTTPMQYNWTGSLAPAATTIIPLPPLIIAGGNHTITDSVQIPNGAPDINRGNNVAVGRVNVYNITQQNLPIATGFEGLSAGTVPAGWVLYDADSNGTSWAVTKNIFGGPAGYGGSTHFLLHNNYYVAKGETNYAILPAAKLPAGAKSLEFAYAHAQFAAESDALDVVWSTDCGATWTSVWSAAGSSLSTAPATTAYFIPTAAQWMLTTVDMSAVPPGAMIAFRAASDYGNSLYLDNIHLSSPLAVGGDVLRAGSARIVPNPAWSGAFADFYLTQGATVSTAVLDITGREVARLMQAPMPAGAQHLALPLGGLAAGVYSVRIGVGGSSVVLRLVKQ